MSFDSEARLWIKDNLVLSLPSTPKTGVDSIILESTTQNFLHGEQQFVKYFIHSSKWATQDNVKELRIVFKSTVEKLTKLLEIIRKNCIDTEDIVNYFIVEICLYIAQENMYLLTKEIMLCCNDIYLHYTA